MHVKEPFVLPKTIHVCQKGVLGEQNKNQGPFILFQFLLCRCLFISLSGVIHDYFDYGVLPVTFLLGFQLERVFPSCGS